MLFRKKKTANKAELDLHIFQTKVELRRLQEKYQTMLERELRLARQEKAAGAAQPGNRQRIKTVYYLLQTTDAAYQSLDDISTADELNRTTNALTAALQQVDRLAASAQGADTRGLKRGLHQMNSNAAELDRAYAQQTKIMAKAAGGAAHRYDQALQELLGEVPSAVPATGTPGGIPQSDEELQAELDAINQNLYRILDET